MKSGGCEGGFERVGRHEGTHCRALRAPPLSHPRAPRTVQKARWALRTPPHPPTPPVAAHCELAAAELGSPVHSRTDSRVSVCFDSPSRSRRGSESETGSDALYLPPTPPRDATATLEGACSLPCFRQLQVEVGQRRRGGDSDHRQRVRNHYV